MRRLATFAGALAVAAVAHGDFFANFEAPAYNGSAAGTALAGQQGWYTPVTTPPTNPYNVFTYTGNPYGMVQNPQGGDQFAAGICGPAGELGRGQHDHDFSTRSKWQISWDRNGMALAGAVALNNLGSFSLQPSGAARFFQSLFLWTDPNTPSLGYQTQYLWWNAAGAQQAFTLPGASWNNQQTNHWYRDSIIIDFPSNRILSISITDLHTNVSDTFAPTDWYLTGGANPTLPLPTAIRLFTGGGAGTSPNGNVLGFDNIIVPEPATALALLAGVAALARRRRK